MSKRLSYKYGTPAGLNNLQVKVRSSDLALLKLVLCWIFFSSVLLPIQPAFACSPSEFWSELRCKVNSELLQVETVYIDEQVLLRIEATEYNQRPLYLGTKEVGRLEEKKVGFWSNTPEVFQAVGTYCSEDFGDERPRIERLYSEWIKQDESKAPFVIEPFSAEKERELIAIQNDLLNCTDVAYEKAGKWLAYYRSEREYCEDSWSPLNPCSVSAHISPGKFAIYVFTYPSTATFPYIIGISSALLILSVGLIFLARRDHLWSFFRPTKFHLWGLALGIPLLCVISLVAIPYFSLQLIGYYIVLCLINYVMETSRSKRDSSSVHIRN